MPEKMLDSKPEADPVHGTDLNKPGTKADAGKPRPALVLGGFARALKEVVKVGTYGAVKYTDNGWMEVPNGLERYDDAKLRHWLDEKCGVAVDRDTQLMHAAHEAWNALARLDLLVREQEKASKSVNSHLAYNRGMSGYLSGVAAVQAAYKPYRNWFGGDRP